MEGTWSERWNPEHHAFTETRNMLDELETRTAELPFRPTPPTGLRSSPQPASAPRNMTQPNQTDELYQNLEVINRSIATHPNPQIKREGLKKLSEIFALLALAEEDTRAESEL